MIELANDALVASGTKESFGIDLLVLRKAAAMLRAVNHNLRQDILRLLHRQGALPVTTIYQELKLEQSVASQHLAVLRHARVVTTQRVGKHVYYAISYERLAEMQQGADMLIN
jgi:DNA-binding transcriptional ArsR family regulator